MLKGLRLATSTRTWFYIYASSFPEFFPMQDRVDQSSPHSGGALITLFKSYNYLGNSFDIIFF